MTVYDLPHVIIEAIGNPVVAYRINTEPGWCIHLPQHEELMYTTAVILLPSYDFSTVQIVSVNDLPEGAEICGDVNTDHEVM